MNLLLAARLGGWLLAGMGALQLVPALAALVFGESVRPFLGTAAGLLALGGGIVVLVRPESMRVRPRDGFFIVTLAWLLASVAGAVPYLATGVLGPVDALFESVAGFTTTGSTVLVAIEDTPRSLLLWRALS